jgi:hypothetical protein
MLEQLIEDFHIVRLGKEIGDGFRDRWADTSDVIEIGKRFALTVTRRGKHRFAEPLYVAIVAREQPRRRFTHMPYAERKDEAVESYVAA